MDPEEIESREFLLSFRGYARDEVEAFREEVVQEIKRLRKQLTKATSELSHANTELAQAKGQLGQAKAQLAEVQAELADERSRRKPELEPELQVTVLAPSPADERAAQFRMVGQETERILLAAEQAAEQIHEQAVKESAEMMTDARLKVQRALEELEAVRRAAEEDFTSIRESRGMVASQLEDIRRRLEEMISRLMVPVQLPGARPESRFRPKPEGGGRPVPPVPVDRVKEAEIQALQRQAREREAARELQARQTAHRAEAKRRDKELRSARAQAEKRARANAEILAAENAVREAAARKDQEEASRRTARAEVERAARAQAGKEAQAEAERAEEQAQERKAADGSKAAGSSLDDLLEEIRRKREEERSSEIGEPDGPLAGSPEAPPEAPAAAPVTQAAVAEALAQRNEALGDLPSQTARRLKRLLQEDHNDLLDRLRTQRGKGALEDNLAPIEEQLHRFQAGLNEAIGRAFSEGRKAAGATGDTDASAAVNKLVSRQVLNPLRTEVSRAVEAGLAAEDSASALSERANDVFRVWKGVRTQLLGEGIAYAAYHQGQLDAWRSRPGARKVWVLAIDEQDCPNDVCRRNAEAGAVDLKTPFPSGHQAPPAHGACTCTLQRS